MIIPNYNNVNNNFLPVLFSILFCSFSRCPYNPEWFTVIH